MKYTESIERYLGDPTTFTNDPEDRSLEYSIKITEWGRKWLEMDILSQEEYDWIISKEPRPGTIYGNIKAQKTNWPLRIIISCRGNVMENLARWVEYHLKEPARKHPAYLKDTTKFFKYIDNINESQGPFQPDQSLFSTRDVCAFYPNCDTQKCVDAVRQVLETDPDNDEEYIECIVEAVQLTMSTNNCEFNNKLYTQINGATIGGPDSGSITDIYGAIHINKKILEEWPTTLENYRRYRDDTCNIELDSSEQKQEETTKWLNENVYPGKIKFEEKTERQNVEFLDVKLTTVKSIEDPEKVSIATDVYSKSTDTHQYLSPKSAHPANVISSIPNTVITRLRKNCSDKVQNDELFKQRVIEYKAYLLKSGYENDLIDTVFIKGMKRKRTDLFVGKKKRQSNPYDVRFITDYEESFPNAHKIFKKYSYLLKNDNALRNVFPLAHKNLKTVYKRGSKNMKELLAPSAINNGLKRQAFGKSEPCGKLFRNPCVHCKFLRETAGGYFRSGQTNQAFRIRQIINCETVNVIYLVSCRKCTGKQGVGHTKSIKKRVSNYTSKINAKVVDCGITGHFVNTPNHSVQDFIFQPIVALENPPQNIQERLKMLRRFEGYWQVRLCTVEPYGFNSINELKANLEFYDYNLFAPEQIGWS